MRLINRAHQIYKIHGLVELFQRTVNNTRWYLKSKIYGKTVTWVSVGDQEAAFVTESPKEYRRFSTLMEEGPIINSMLANIDSSDTVWDIGANVGMYTCYLAQISDVVAFEPHPATVERLQENVKQNSLDVTVCQYALGAESHKSNLSISESGDIGVGTHSISSESDSSSISIEIQTGSDVIDKGISAPNVLKIDVEGAEHNVLKGLGHYLSKECRLIYCEVHPDELEEYGASESDVHKLLQSKGFEIVKIDMGGGKANDLIAIKPGERKKN